MSREKRVLGQLGWPVHRTECHVVTWAGRACSWLLQESQMRQRGSTTAGIEVNGWANGLDPAQLACSPISHVGGSRLWYSPAGFIFQRLWRDAGEHPCSIKANLPV